MEYRGTAKDFGAFLERTVGHVGYLIGTRGELCTEALIAKKTIEYPSYAVKIQKYARQWLGMPVADCLGWEEMFENGGDVGKPVTAFKHPDRRTYNDAALAISLNLPHGAIATLPKDKPDVPIAVAYTGHVGFYYKGMVYQSAGHQPGTIITPLDETVHNYRWNTWYYCPYLDYTEVDMIIVASKGTKSDVVGGYQYGLVKLGYNLGTYPDKNGVPNGCDGSFGGTTASQNASFKAKYGLDGGGEVITDYDFAKVCELLYSLPTGGVSQEEYDKVVAENTQLEKENIALEMSWKNAVVRENILIDSIRTYTNALAELEKV